MSEVDIGKKARSWLIDQGWEVHCEVRLAYAGERADIVARLGGVLWVVECKASLGFAVLAQATRWEGYAHMVSVAVLAESCCRAIGAATRCFQHLGVGLIRVGYEVRQEVRPRLCRRVVWDRLANCLCDETRAFEEPGSKAGDYHTPFRRTCRRIAEELERRPGLTTKELVEAVDHHYSSDLTAKSALVKWMRSGVIEGVRAEGRPLRWYVEEKR